MKKDGIFETVKSFIDFHSRKIRLKLIFYSLLTGVITGTIVSAYTYLLSKITIFRNNFIGNNINLSLPLIILLFIVVAMIIQYTLNKYPLISGSGIPQVMGLIQKKVKFNWFPELITKFFSGLLAIFIGFSLGREGPSIHLGSLVGEGVNEVSKRTEVERKYLITCGASAGLAAAFNAPLAGAIFAIEELHKFFSPILLICVLIASLFSNLVSKFLLGTKLSFESFSFISPVNFVPKEILLHLILISILSFIMVLLATIFNYFIIKFKDTYTKINLSPYTKMSVVSLLSLLIIYFLPDITGGGHHIIEHLLDYNSTFRLLGLVMIGKFFFTMLSYSTGAPGGIFLPLLVIGALVGKIYGLFLVGTFNFSQEYITLFVLVAMTSYFTAVVRTPITGIILILEMTGNFSNLFSLVITAAITYAFSELLKHNSVYEELFENMFKKQDEEAQTFEKNEKIVTIKIPVMSDSKLSNKMIRDIDWPQNLLIIGIERSGSSQFIPKGDTVLKDSDILILLTDENTSKRYMNKLSELTIENIDIQNI
ncbi:ClC family H(+)/Cl(-) exchange transporter [Streptobacillus felis]|uniref:ClC family H(+)/Cl(-) exchange transporter n=1 Tax=Streptobacillus felis TaxID=1384509 RepID=A0A7Z0T6M3_9FUSO|nr:ClC family H(+)/Cl(-) exchange transporter [Streptobacillus felis]NYV27366.1 ClC family H(+)/Cl(-) exchange transporter [Streptobacillus felis]